MSKHRFPYRWNIADGYPAKGIENHGKKVFGTFICGGGSSMGYKLAGYHHLGGVELDPKIAEIYKKNQHPQHLFNMDIRDFNKIANEDLPPELFTLDLLDGSPPCSTFSTAGSREKAWGKEKQFAEGQKLQTLDDLVFVYCDTIAKLQPKCCLLENVSGLVKGNAKTYAKAIVKKLNEIGYDVQIFLLNGATMGVPQARQRVFFIGHKKEYKLPKLVLNFNEDPIYFGEIQEDDNTKTLTDHQFEVWSQRIKSDTCFFDTIERTKGKGSAFNYRYFHKERVADTLGASRHNYITYDYPRQINDNEMKLIGSYPMDYHCPDEKTLGFLVGMSVPPVMTAQIAYEIYKQWLSKIN